MKSFVDIHVWCDFKDEIKKDARNWQWVVQRAWFIYLSIYLAAAAAAAAAAIHRIYTIKIDLSDTVDFGANWEIFDFVLFCSALYIE